MNLIHLEGVNPIVAVLEGYKNQLNQQLQVVREKQSWVTQFIELDQYCWEYSKDNEEYYLFSNGISCSQWFLSKLTGTTSPFLQAKLVTTDKSSPIEAFPQFVCSAKPYLKDLKEEQIFVYLRDTATSPYGYTTTMTMDANKTYVKVTSPAGSQVAFSVPTKIIQAILDSCFSNKTEEALKLVAGRGIVNIEDLVREPEKLATLLKIKDKGKEAVTFSFAPGDFEGRNELKKVLKRVVEIAAKETGILVCAVGGGLLSNDSYALTSINLKGGELSQGSWFVSPPNCQSTGLQPCQTCSFSDLVSGSIYLAPLEQEKG